MDPETGLDAVLAMQGAKHRCPRGWQSRPWGGACGPEYLSPAQGRRPGPARACAPHPRPRRPRGCSGSWSQVKAGLEPSPLFRMQSGPSLK